MGHQTMRLSSAIVDWGDKIALHYRFTSLKDDEKDTIDSRVKTEDPRGVRPDLQMSGEPLEALIGARQIMRSMEEGCVGLRSGDANEFDVSAVDAFGEKVTDIRVPFDQMPPELIEKIGGRTGVPVLTQQGHVLMVKEVDENAKDIVFDPNHPLAGHDVRCELEIVSVTKSADMDFSERLVVPSMDDDDCVEGDGETFPKRGDTCVMHYTGELLESGAKFDSSRDRGQPFEFTIGVGQVIQGWDEGVSNMSKGQRAVLKIPSQKGYGEKGAGDAIPPNADLKFDVELIDIKRPNDSSNA